MSQPPLPHIDEPARKPRPVVRPTFFIVLVLAVLITLFQAPVYQATAVILLPPSLDPTATAKALQARDVLVESAAKVSPGEADQYFAHAVASGPAMPGRFALLVESNYPEYTSALANAWAETITADSSGQAKVLQAAETPHIPIRPKKTQNILLGALFGLGLGFLLKFIRSKRQPVPR